MDYQSLYDGLHYRFSDEQLLSQALTHPSAGARNNQRLEYLGDAVLEFYISERLYHLRPELHEGQLTSLRQTLVCEEALFDVARKIDLGRYLMLDAGLVTHGGRQHKSILADAVEALIAAVHLDSRGRDTDELIRRFWPDERLKAGVTDEPKNTLQEMLQKRNRSLPVYNLLEKIGPDHDPVFTVGVSLDGQQLAVGDGKTKKDAERSAARKAIEALQKGHKDRK